jgi:elongation factor Ts
MAEVSATLVKSLRDKTGAGMMDCKKALAETQGDIEAAQDWLRKQGLASAAKKAGRIAADGVIALSESDNEAALVEVNAETDFVARNPEFQAFARKVAEVARSVSGDVEKIKAAKFGNGTVGDELTRLVSTIGENLTVRRAVSLAVKPGVVGSYVHLPSAPGLGKIGVLVALESAGKTEDLKPVARQIAMHIAAANPQWATIEAVDKTALERERAILADQAKSSGKAENVIAKMVEGRLRKFYEETVLTEQIFVVDNETKIRKVLEDAGKKAGAPVTVKGFVRFALGEGVERKETDFAAEVAATLKQ